MSSSKRIHLKFLYLCLIIHSYFEKIIVIETYPSKIYNLLSKKTIIISYYHEIWQDFDQAGTLSYDYFNRVKLVIAPQSDRARLAESLYKKAKIFIVENCPELNSYKEYEKLNFFPTVLYQGQITNLSNAKKLFEIVSKLRHVEVHLAGFVHADYKEELQKLTRSNKNIIYHGVLKNSELFALRRKSSIGLVTWTNDHLSTKFAAPTKLYDYISDGLYVVSLPNHSLEQLNKKYCFGYVGKGSDDIISVILELTEFDLEKQYYANKNLFKSELNFENQVKDFMVEFTELLKNDF